MTDTEKIIIAGLLIEIKDYIDKAIVFIERETSGNCPKNIDDVKKYGNMPSFYSLLEEQIEKIKQ